jgi:hypothetical protein
MPGQKTIDDIEDNPSTYRDASYRDASTLHHSANDTTYEDLLQAESMIIKERTLERIRTAQRDRAFSNLTQSVCSQESYWGGEDSDDSDTEPFNAHSVSDPVVAHNTYVNASNHFVPLLSTDRDSAHYNSVHPPSLQPPLSSHSSVSSATPGHPSLSSLNKLDENDVRKELFEAIPEPYYFSTEFSRVKITDTNDPIDSDTKDACRSLKNAMDIRQKWISQHPDPPQDEEIFDYGGFSQTPSHVNVSSMMSPKSPGRKFAEGAHRPEFRRRSVPPYEVFDLPLPPTDTSLRFKMIDGVICVTAIDPKKPLIHQSSTDSLLGLYVPTEEGGEGRSMTPDMDVHDDENLSVDTSLFPVFSYKEFFQDFSQVSS